MNRELSRRTFIKLSSATAASLFYNLFFDKNTAFAPEFSADLSPSPKDPLTEYLEPIIKQVSNKRAKRALVDNLFYERVDPELNKDRINILLFIWGETHEPPDLERATIGSHSLISVNNTSHAADKISWTHDIRSPEVERFLIDDGKPFTKAIKIDQAFFAGGFDLMRQTVESATGLSIDFQIAFSDEIMVDLINKIYGKLKINNPKKFRAHSIYYKENKYPEEEFKQGVVEVDGLKSLYYIKSVPVNDADPQIEHNQRKYRVLKSLKERTSGIIIYLQLLRFLQEKADAGVIQLDFNPSELFYDLENLNSFFKIGTSMLSDNSMERIMPKDGKEIYIVDPAHGDGGVQWTSANAAFNPITRKDFDLGIYNKDFGYEVPYHPDLPFTANPYATDLINDYWFPMRWRIKELLTRS